MNKILIYEVQTIIDGLVGLLQVQNFHGNSRAKKEVIIEVDTLTQATQIMSFILEEYGELFGTTEIGFYESHQIGEKAGGSFYFTIDGKYWSVGFNSVDADMIAELSDSDTVVLDLRTMVW